MKILIAKHGQIALYLVYNTEKNIPNLSSFAACCGTRRIWPLAVMRRTAIITTHGRRRQMPRSPSVSACPLEKNGKNYVIQAQLGMTSCEVIGLEVNITQVTRARYSCLLRAYAASVVARWLQRAPTVSIGLQHHVAKVTITRAASTLTQELSIH